MGVAQCGGVEWVEALVCQRRINMLTFQNEVDVDVLAHGAAASKSGFIRRRKKT